MQELLEKIKQIPPEVILSRLQIPFKRVGRQIKAQAVWRGERNASVSIQHKNDKWLWHDFGTGEGGDWIDLYRRYTGSDFKEAVSTLSELANVPYSADISTREAKIGSDRKKSSSLSQAEFEELERVPLREFGELPKDLEEYLEKKGFLPYWEQVKEIPELYYLRYRRGNKNKEYSGLAIRTTAGTWVIKNQHGTYVSGSPSGISLWRRNPAKIMLVEGFADAIALSVYPEYKDFSILILNGLGNLDKAMETLKLLSPEEICVALDLDKPGRQGRAKVIREFPEAEQLLFEGKDPAEHLLKNGSNRSPTREKVFFAGVVEDTVNQLVIADSEKALKKLGAKETTMVLPGGVPELWGRWKCRGYVEIYAVEPASVPGWVRQDVQACSRQEKVKVPYMSNLVVQKVQPTEIRVQKYWNVDGEPLFENDIYQNPSLYKKCDVEEIRRLSEEIRRRREEEEKKLYRRRRDDYGPPGPGL